MKWFNLIRKNIFRNKRRTWLTFAAIILAIFIFTTLMTVLESLQMQNNKNLTGLRLAVLDKYGDPHVEQPLHYIKDIKQVNGIEAITPLAFAVLTPEEGGAKIYITWSVYPEEYAVIFKPEISNIDKQHYSDFKKTKNGLIVGQEIFENNNWAVGDYIQLKSLADNFMMDFIICGVYTNFNNADKQLESQMLMHYDYYNEKKGNSEMVNFFWLKVKNQSFVPPVINSIEQRFEYAQSEIAVQTENTMAAKLSSFTSTAQMVIKLVALLVMITIFLVVANTIALTMRDRRKEIAVLKTLGFTRFRILKIVIAEVVFVSTCAGLIGTLLSTVLFSVADLSFTMGLTFNFKMTYQTFALGILLSIILGVKAGLLPAIIATKSNISSALRSL